MKPTTQYVEFRPARRVEEYVGQKGPHFGLALSPDVLDAMAQAKVTGKAHGYLVRGEWRRSDGVTFLDFAIDRAWVDANTNYRLQDDGRLRWTCPVCGRLSGSHNKGCDYE